jgi:hypothetical protein
VAKMAWKLPKQMEHQHFSWENSWKFNGDLNQSYVKFVKLPDGRWFNLMIYIEYFSEKEST